MPSDKRTSRLLSERREEDHGKDRCLRFLDAQGKVNRVDGSTGAVASRLGLTLVFVVTIRLLANGNLLE